MESVTSSPTAQGPKIKIKIVIIKNYYEKY
jgi:hypothetical protein